MPSKPRTRRMYNQLDLTLYPYLPTPYFNLGLIIFPLHPHDCGLPLLKEAVVNINSLPHTHSQYHAVLFLLPIAGRNTVHPWNVYPVKSSFFGIPFTPLIIVCPNFLDNVQALSKLFLILWTPFTLTLPTV